MAIFSTRPSYSWSPSRKKYVRDCGLETTAIIPLGARTIPSRRSVLTCRPAFPGGSGPAGPPPCSRPINDSKGSRLATFVSFSAVLAPLAAGFATFGVDFFACFGARFAAAVPGFAPGLAGFALLADGACLLPEAAGLLVLEAVGLFCAAEAGAAAGFAGAGAATLAAGLSAGFAACDVALAAAGVAGFVLAPLAGLACACRPGTTAASVIPNTRVFTKCIFRSFPFRVSPPVSPDLLLQHRLHSAW